MLHDGSTNLVYGLARIKSGTSTWYQHDGLGSVCAVLDASGAVQSTTSYDPWGTPQTPLADSFGFTGELQFGEQVHLRARWYNTTHGTFTARDPFEGFDTQPYSLHPYQYAYSNPVLLTDPSGEAVACGLGILGGPVGWAAGALCVVATYAVAAVTGAALGTLLACGVGIICPSAEFAPSTGPQPVPAPAPLPPEAFPTDETPTVPSLPAPAPAPQPVPSPTPERPGIVLPDMWDCPQPVPTPEFTPQPEPTILPTPTPNNDYIYRAGKNRAKSLSLHRPQDWKTGLSFTEMPPPGDFIKFRKSTLRSAGYVVRPDGEQSVFELWTNHPMMDSQTGQQIIFPSGHVTVYHADQQYWDQWHQADLANKGTPNVSLQLQTFYNLRES